MKKRLRHTTWGTHLSGLLLLLTLLFHTAAWAGPRSFQQAQAIAQRQAALQGIQMQQQSLSRARDRYQQPQENQASQEPEYYVFNNGANQGFTIVSGDDRMPEVVAYSAQGCYDEAQLSAGCAQFMEAYSQMVAALNTGNPQVAQTLAQRQQANTNYQQPAVAPLLGDIKWNQFDPFNNYCPEYRSGYRAVTGCVATAMAQVMRYYKYPKELKADIPAYVTPSNGISMPAIAKGETYDWDHMTARYTSSSTQEENDAVAKLMLHCGAAVAMDYGSESAAYLDPNALVTYFGYDADLLLSLNRSDYNLQEWMHLIDRELTSSRPVLYSGFSSNSGHQYICDGSDGKGLYHINWGWGGLSDGYFDITILAPSSRGAGAGITPDGYNRDCSIIIGVTPDNGKADQPLVTGAQLWVDQSSYSSFQIAQSQRTDASGTFSIKMGTTFVCYGSHAEFEGRVAVGVMNADGSYTPISRTYPVHVVRPNLSVQKYAIDYAFPEGVTMLYDLYSVDEGATWQPCGYTSYAAPHAVRATATTLQSTTDFLHATLTALGPLYKGQINPLELSITNEGSEYLGLLKVYSRTKPERPNFNTISATANEYVCIPTGNTVSRQLVITPSSEGSLYVWVTDKNGNVLVDGKELLVTTASAPQLALIAKSTNATPGEYETQNAYYGAQRVKMPKIEEGKAELTYSIKNYGGSYYMKASLQATGYTEQGTSGAYTEERYVLLEGNGATTQITFQLSPADLEGSRSFYADLTLQSAQQVTLSIAVSQFNLQLLDKPGYYYPITGTAQVGYISGTDATGITPVSKSGGLRIGTAPGMLLIQSPTAQQIPVYGIDGHLVSKATVTSSRPATLRLRPGVYIVAGKKVLVK